MTDTAIIAGVSTKRSWSYWGYTRTMIALAPKSNLTERAVSLWGRNLSLPCRLSIANAFEGRDYSQIPVTIALKDLSSSDRSDHRRGDHRSDPWDRHNIDAVFFHTDLVDGSRAAGHQARPETMECLQIELILAFL